MPKNNNNTNRNTESESNSNNSTISNATLPNNNLNAVTAVTTLPTAPKEISERRQKYLQNKNAAHATLKQASKNLAEGKWTPRAHNIMGLLRVRRTNGDENTFIKHAISRWEKRQINQELLKESKEEVRAVKKRARETKKAAKEANMEARRLLRQTKKAAKASEPPKTPGKRGRPKKSNTRKVVEPAVIINASTGNKI